MSNTATVLPNRKVELLDHFKRLYTSSPDWAWTFPPSIPFVGQDYCPGEGILVYASAENLSWMYEKETPERFKADQAWDRYRAAYEETGRDSGAFYPDVGIAPVSNGGLLVAARFIAEKIVTTVVASPRRFLETLALSNWAKFTIKSEKNVDYITDTSKTVESFPFVIAELMVLRPAVVLIPKAIWDHPIHRAAMRGASPSTHYLPIPQFNAQVVNCHLTAFERQATELRGRLAGSPTAAWMAELKNLNLSHAWRYLALLESHPIA